MSGYSAGNFSDLGIRQSSDCSSIPGIGPLKEAYRSYTFLGYGELPGSESKVSELALENLETTHTDVDIRVQCWQLQRLGDAPIFGLFDRTMD